MLIFFRGSEWHSGILRSFLGQEQSVFKNVWYFLGVLIQAQTGTAEQLRDWEGGGTLVTQSWGAQDTFSY